MPDTMRIWQSRLRRILRRILSSHHSPRQIAAGAALGILIGFTPLMGLHMILAAVLSTFFGFSRLASVPMVYITIPVTAPFVYPGCYLLGVWMLRPFGFHVLSPAKVRALFVLPDGPGLWSAVWIKLQELFSLGWEGLAPLWLGCLVVGSVSAIAMYYASLRFVTGHRLLKAQRMALRAQQRLERIRHRQEEERREGGGET